MENELPKTFIAKYQHLLGAQAAPFLASFKQPATHGFRLNPAKSSTTLVNEDLSQPVLGVDNGYYGQVSGKSIDHLAGWVYSQDPSAMNVAQFAQPRPGERVLDLCAAPGGKSTQLAAFLHGDGLLVANEINSARARTLSSNIERWGITNAVVTNNSPEQLAKVWPQYFDCIVVDAPCSGEGLFRKDPEAMKYWSLDYVLQCAKLQRQILDSAVTMLQPGGRLIYSTCTFAPEEDEQNIAWLVDNYPVKIMDLPTTAQMDQGYPEWGNGHADLAKAVRLFPHHYAGEGHFICALQKNGTPDASSKTQAVVLKHSKNKKRTSLDLTTWQQFVQQTLTQSLDIQPLVQGIELYSSVVDGQAVPTLHVLRNGLKLGTFKKNRFEPNHALVLALAPEQFQQVIELTAEQFQHFVHGEALTLQQHYEYQGFVAVSFEHKIFSWGKLVQQQLKNFYPKGLRQ